MLYNKGVASTIKLLMRFGHQIVQLEDQYFLVKSFEEANGNSWKHHLVGKDITDMIEQYYSIHGLDDSKKGEISQRINNLPSEERFFHKDIRFILYVPRI